ncbi:MAG: putative porin [Thermodesulfobacteriota bacterium]|nr:putative porin [Thermodesulfobacteriota bacterium]
MKRIVYVMMTVVVLVMALGSSPCQGGEVDVLIKKLVEKGVLSNSDADQIIREIREESKIVKEEIRQPELTAAEDKPQAGKSKLQKWITDIDFYGDLRLRHDTQWRHEEETGGERDNYHRNRERLRFRFGAKAQTTETTEVGFRLASGSGFQNTTNQSFDEHARGKHIFIDRAYAAWKPTKQVTILGGKHKNPLFTTQLVWDPDVNPEGVSESVRLSVSDRVSIFGTLGQWFIEELNVKDTNSDPVLLAFQCGSSIKLDKGVSLDLALSYYDFQNLDDLEWEDGVLSDKEEFLGYNNKHGQQMVFDDEGVLLNEFGCWELGAKLKFKEILPVPVSVFGSYIKNSDADIDDLVNGGADPGDSDPLGLLAYGGDDRDSGWQIGLSVGAKKEKGDCYMKYFYQELEDYAFPAVFVDSDFHGGGTNNKGHYIQGRYYLRNNIQARATGYLTEREDDSKDGKKDEDRLQLDLIFTF